MITKLLGFATSNLWRTSTIVLIGAIAVYKLLLSGAVEDRIVAETTIEQNAQQCGETNESNIELANQALADLAACLENNAPPDIDYFSINQKLEKQLLDERNKAMQQAMQIPSCREWLDQPVRCADD